MSANALTVSVLVVLVLAAAAIRVVIGPIAGVAGKDGAYALAKIGPVPEPEAARVEMARSDVRRGE
jgi:hypothetical protein